MSTRLTLAALTAVLLQVTLWSTQVAAQDAAALDGRNYVIALNDPTMGVLPDHLIFNAGTLESVGCRLYGFGPSTYEAAADGEAVTFSASATSETEGTVAWQGRAVGDTIEGTMVWSKENQEDTTYTYTGGLASTALDGRTFTTTLTPAEPGAETDQMIFADGTFESEGCREYGFTPTAYGTSQTNGSIAFSALTYSATEGMMAWTGTVTGDQMEGTALWLKLGQDATTFAFAGTAAATE